MVSTCYSSNGYRSINQIDDGPQKFWFDWWNFYFVEPWVQISESDVGPKLLYDCPSSRTRTLPGLSLNTTFLLGTAEMHKEVPYLIMCSVMRWHSEWDLVACKSPFKLTLFLKRASCTTSLLPSLLFWLETVNFSSKNWPVDHFGLFEYCAFFWRDWIFLLHLFNPKFVIIPSSERLMHAWFLCFFNFLMVFRGIQKNWLTGCIRNTTCFLWNWG